MGPEPENTMPKGLCPLSIIKKQEREWEWLVEDSILTPAGRSHPARGGVYSAIYRVGQK